MMERPKTVILHVGPHKTGTTHLQAAFVRNRTRLETGGVGYSDRHIYLFGHHHLPEALRSENFDLNGPVAAEFRDAFLTHDTNVISSEEFAKLSMPELETLRDLFADCTVKVVYFLRHPMHMFPSLWQEMIKHGADLTFHDFMETTAGRADHYELDVYSNTSQLLRMASVFGRTNLSLPIFENVMASGEDLFDYFVRNYLPASVGAVELEKLETSTNASLPPRFTELIRCMNLVCREEFPELAPPLVTSAFNKHQSEIVTDPKFQVFFEKFKTHWQAFTLGMNDEIFVKEEVLICNLYADLIPNKMETGRLRQFDEEATKTVPYAARRWIYSEDQAEYIRALIRTYVLSGG